MTPAATTPEPTGEGGGSHPADDRHHRLSTQLVRFVITGCLSAVVDFGLLNLLMLVFGWDHTPAKAVSFVAGTATAYAINRRWTFRAEASTKRFLATMILYGITFVVQVGLYAVLFPLFSQLNTPDGAALPVPVVNVIAFVIAQGVATTANFIVQRTVIFRLQHPEESGR
ncbi:GtrA family protein [Propionibacteriaceae bacterium Y2011]